MLTVGNLKKFIKDVPDSCEVRLVVETDRETGKDIHHECTEILDKASGGERLIILTPDETHYV